MKPAEKTVVIVLHLTALRLKTQRLLCSARILRFLSLAEIAGNPDIQRFHFVEQIFRHGFLPLRSHAFLNGVSGNEQNGGAKNQNDDAVPSFLPALNNLERF